MTISNVGTDVLGYELGEPAIQADFMDDDYDLVFMVTARASQLLRLRDIRTVDCAKPVRTKWWDEKVFWCSDGRTVNINYGVGTVSAPVEVVDDLVRQVEELQSRYP